MSCLTDEQRKIIENKKKIAQAKLKCSITRFPSHRVNLYCGNCELISNERFTIHNVSYNKLLINIFKTIKTRNYGK